MLRRDLLRNSLLLGGASLLDSLPLSWAVACHQTARVVLLSEDDSGGRQFIRALQERWHPAQMQCWSLPAGQWLQAERLAEYLQGPPGLQLYSLLSAANHSLLIDALRQHGAAILGEYRLRASPRAISHLAVQLAHAPAPEIPEPHPHGLPLHALYATR